VVRKTKGKKKKVVVLPLLNSKRPRRNAQAKKRGVATEDNLALRQRAGKGEERLLKSLRSGFLGTKGRNKGGDYRRREGKEDCSKEGKKHSASIKESSLGLHNGAIEQVVSCKGSLSTKGEGGEPITWFYCVGCEPGDYEEET